MDSFCYIWLVKTPSEHTVVVKGGLREKKTSGGLLCFGTRLQGVLQNGRTVKGGLQVVTRPRGCLDRRLKITRKER